MNANAQLLCLWAGPAMLFFFWLGFMFLAGYLPPPEATLSPDELVAMLRANIDGFRLGMVVTMFGFALMVPWAVGIATRLQHVEGRYPVLLYTQIGSVAIGSLIGQAATWIFEATVYRLDDTPPVIVRALHDLGWFTFLAPWPSFSVWCVALGLAIFLDRREQPDYPRWAAYLCLWTALLFVPACLIFWFKKGPFSWSGVVAFYVPVAIFFVWVTGLTVPALKAVYRERALAARRETAEPALISGG
jgi:hypothetical protein